MGTILKALEALGVALADHNHQWSPELRSLYEKAVQLAKVYIADVD